MASAAPDRLAPSEAAWIAGHLGDWRIGQSGPAALERGLRFAISRYAAFPDAACFHDRAAAHRVAVDQVLELAGFRGGDDVARRRAIVDAFNRVDDAVNLAAIHEEARRMKPIVRARQAVAALLLVRLEPVFAPAPSPNRNAVARSSSSMSREKVSAAMRRTVPNWPEVTIATDGARP